MRSIGRYTWQCDPQWFESCWLMRPAPYGPPRDHWDGWKAQGFGLDFLAAAELTHELGRTPTEDEIDVKVVMLRLEGLT